MLWAFGGAALCHTERSHSVTSHTYSQPGIDLPFREYTHHFLLATVLENSFPFSLNSQWERPPPITRKHSTRFLKHKNQLREKFRIPLRAQVGRN